MDLRKLQSEVEPKRSAEVFEILRADTNLFADWTKFDIQKLCENIKILAYGRNATIIHKNEIIEYFAIVLGGKLLIKQGDKVIGYLGAGDVLGYMAYMDLAGTKASPFEVTGEIEGYIAVFRYDEFKMLNKKEPELSFKITETLAKKTLNTISLQYLGEEMYTPSKLKGSGAATNTKRVKDAMDTCPELSEFFGKFDQRDRKNLQKNLEYIEFDKEQRIVHEGKKADYLIILIKGELISFKENKPTVFYKPGSIIGRKEFLFGLTWQENILGKAKGVLLKLERQNFDEMVIGSNLSANNLLKALVWHESKDIKNRYQDRSMFEKMKGQNVTNPLNEFVEYEITKHLNFINEQQAKAVNGKPAIKDFLLKKETLPLYMHSIHQTLAMTQVDGAEKTQKSSNATVAGCAFLREKLEKQMAELRSQKGKRKLAAKPAPKVNADGRRMEERPADEEYEDLKNNYILLEGENDELRTKLNEMFEESKALRNEIRKMKELTVTSSTQINKSMIHKELLSKDLINSDPSSILTKNYNQVSSTFGDVLKEQHLVSTKARRVAKYAYKWLANVKAKKRMMMI